MLLARVVRGSSLIGLMVALALSAAFGGPRYVIVSPGVEVTPPPGELLESGQSLVVRLSGDAALPTGKPVQVFFDSHDVSEQAVRSGSQLTISVPANVVGGLHRVRLVIPTVVGAPREAVWSFQTPAPTEGDLHDTRVTVTDSAKKTLYEGDTLTVTAQGPAGGKATAYVADKFRFPLSETTPGTYSGAYDIQRTDYVLGTPIRVRVTMPNGEVVGNSSENLVKVLGQMFTVRVDSPINGSIVPYDFVIKGHTRPHARVSISPSVGAPVSPAAQSASSVYRQHTIQTVRTGMGGWDVEADEHGYFEQKFGFPLHMFNISYQFILTAVDRKGDQAIPSNLFVKLRGTKGEKPKGSSNPVVPSSTPTDKPTEKPSSDIDR